MKKRNTTAVVAAKVPRDESSDMTTALNVHLDEIVFPKGVETLGQKANFLHGYSVEASKRANGAAIMAGWVLSVARSTCSHGQWYAWLAQNVSFGKSTATNYMNLYAQTLGKARANARRPIALTVEPTVAELEAAAHDVDGSTLAALYKSTRIMAANPDHGGKREGAGRKAKVAPTPDEAAQKAAARAELVADEGCGLIEDLTAWALGEEDGFGSLDDAALAKAVKALDQMLARAKEIQKSRRAGR